MNNKISMLLFYMQKKHKRSIITTIFFISIIFFFQKDIYAEDKKNNDYEQLKTEYYSATKDASYGKTSSNIEKLEAISEKFEAFLKLNNDKTLELKASFLIGNLYTTIYGFSKKKDTLNLAIKHYNSVYTKDPKHTLADDSLYALSNLYYKAHKTELALDYLQKIILEYPKGDQVELAKKMKNSILLSDNNEKNIEAVETQETMNDKDDSTLKIATDSKNEANKLTNNGDIKDKPSSETTQKTLAMINDIKIWPNQEYTRIALHINENSNYKLLLKSIDNEKILSPLEIQLPKVSFDNKFLQKHQTEEGFLDWEGDGDIIKNIRFLETKDAMTISLNHIRAKKYRVMVHKIPKRITIDIYGDKQTDSNIIMNSFNTKKLDIEPKTNLLELDNTKNSHKSKKEKKFIIVLDPGHGGDDTGAKSHKYEVMEKDIVLAIAFEIKSKLSLLPGIDVILTRDTDVFIPLDNRTKIANDAQADLFISIHANAALNTDLAGIETYYLDTASDEGAEKLAIRENESAKDKSTLGLIVQDLFVHSNVSDSKRLAKLIQDTTITRLKKHYPPQTVKDLGVKTALFYVLLGSKMPSVLLETAFITNQLEEERLINREYQQYIAESVVSAVKRYITNNDKHGINK